MEHTSPNTLLNRIIFQSPNNPLKLALYPLAYVFFAAGKFLPETIFAAIAMHLYNQNNESIIQKLQKELTDRMTAISI